MSSWTGGSNRRVYFTLTESTHKIKKQKAALERLFVREWLDLHLLPKIPDIAPGTPISVERL